MQNEVFGAETARKSQVPGSAPFLGGTEVLDNRRSNPYYPPPTNPPHIEMANYN